MSSAGQGTLFVVSGPSGSGKTTLVQGALKRPELKRKISRSISFTTRPKRSKEKEGRDYFFISTALFKKKKKEQKILEWTRYLGYYYGTPGEFVDDTLARGRHLILCLDLRGARRIKRLYPKNTVTIFVLPPSLGVLKGRIEKRCVHTAPQEIARRLRRAQDEVAVASGYEYRIVNAHLNQSVQALEKIIKQRLKKIRS